jgi:cellulose synthase/poly-beta-1,6-N-acetylglucosamine synthase-like glycosyltransferase
MPLYNKERDVARAIRSALAQSFTDYELIIVNDGSTDRSLDAVAVFNDPRIRLVHQENQGVSAARNRGVAEARAELVAFLDADDEWMEDFLETIICLRSRYPSCRVFGTRYFFCSPSGLKKLAVIKGISHDMQEGILTNYFVVAAQSDPPLWTSAIAVAKEAIETIGGFPLRVISGEDLLTWARLGARFQIAYSMKPCAIYYNPQTVSDRPGRIPQEPDTVGDSLRCLLNQANSATIPGLKGYIALWHRMRAVIFLQLGDKRNVRKEVREAMHFAPSLRLALIFFIAFLPGSLAAKSLAVMKRIKSGPKHRIGWYRRIC